MFHRIPPNEVQNPLKNELLGENTSEHLDQFEIFCQSVGFKGEMECDYHINKGQKIS